MTISIFSADFGSNPLFRSLENQLTTSLPLDTCEWKRSFGRPNKNVRLDGQFKPYDANTNLRNRTSDWSILEHPVLHIFVTDCSDVDAYKATVKDEIDSWLRSLNANGHTDDWMILQVETSDSKKTKNLLPRTTVLDKLRLDFGAGKNAADRCISVLHPVKHEVRATESFRCLLNRMRALMLIGFNRNIVRYEELIRAHREKRQQAGWCYVRHFGLQEQLAVVLEMLGLHLEALVQYDELDAMFGQEVLLAEKNGERGDGRPPWLRKFEERPLHQFHGIALAATTADRMAEARRRIAAGTATVLEFRSYLYARQTTLLAAADQHWEIAERFMPFVFGTLREVEIVLCGSSGGGAVAVDGAMACWQFVCAIEVLTLCDAAVAGDAAKDATNIFQYTAPIWELAKDRLYELGELCGLLPGQRATSAQLHAVVQLSAGIGDGDGVDEEAALVERRVAESAPHLTNRSVQRKCATERLKEALGSNEAFKKLYLELSELAISTYKHVSRLRSARLVGLDLGMFYCALGEPHKAVVFFGDLLRELKAEQWPTLVGRTLLELAGCYRQMNDDVALMKVAATIACCEALDAKVRAEYFDEWQRSMMVVVEKPVGLGVEQPQEGGVLVTLEDHFTVRELRVVTAAGGDEKIIQDEMLNVEIRLKSRFPREIVAAEVALSYEMVEKSTGGELTTVALNGAADEAPSG